jgi:hypothetical protein
MYSTRYTGHILMQLEFPAHIAEKYSNIKFHENLSSGGRVVPYGRTDMTKLNSSFFGILRTPLKIHTGNCFPPFKLHAFSVHNAVTKLTALCYLPNNRLTNKIQWHFCFVFQRTRLRSPARIPTTLTHILRYVPSVHPHTCPTSAPNAPAHCY